MALVQARGLGKSYGSRVAVEDLSFDVRPGRVTGFLGPNGAGKSTTMRLMLGLDHGRGTCTFDGKALGDLDQPMRHVGALLEAKPFHPTRKARNHLRMLAAAHRVPSSRVDEVLAQLGIDSVAKGKPRSFSLGMGQRLGLAAALLCDPHTLVLDEPANGLDPQGMQWMRQLLRHLAAQGRSVLVSSHLLSEMALMADDLVVIGRGRLIAAGPADEFIASTSTASVLVVSPEASRLADLLARTDGVGVSPGAAGGELVVTGADAAAVGDVAHEHGIRLHQLATRTESLEDVFLRVTGQAQEFWAADPAGRDGSAHSGPAPAGPAPQAGTPQPGSPQRGREEGRR